MIRPDEATRLAEQALLGSLILDPQSLASVRRWLRPGDFSDPRHGTVFSLLRECDTAGDPIDPMAVAGDLAGRLPSASPGVVVHDLLQAVPAAPNAGTYGRIVVEASLRREVAGVGILLRLVHFSRRSPASPCPCRPRARWSTPPSTPWPGVGRPPWASLSPHRIGRRYSSDLRSGIRACAWARTSSCRTIPTETPRSSRRMRRCSSEPHHPPARGHSGRRPPATSTDLIAVLADRLRRDARTSPNSGSRSTS